MHQNATDRFVQQQMSLKGSAGKTAMLGQWPDQRFMCWEIIWLLPKLLSEVLPNIYSYNTQRYYASIKLQNDPVQTILNFTN